MKALRLTVALILMLVSATAWALKPISGITVSGTTAWTFVACTRVADDTFTVENTAANVAVVKTGVGFRTADVPGTWRYSQITAAVAAGATITLTLAGVPLTAAFDAHCQWSLPPMVFDLPWSFPGQWSDGASATLILSDLLFSYLWGSSQAYLVRIRAMETTADSGANEPRVNAVVDGNAVCTANAGAGLEMPDPVAWVETTTDIDPATYDIGLDSTLEVSTDANGSNNDSANLSLLLTFVLE